MPGSPTPNLGLTQGTVAGDTGVWGGSPGINGNNTVLDSVIGQVTTISLNNSNVVLNAAQFQSAELVFSSTLTGSVTITFPTSFIKGYTIQHLCTGSSAFTITLTTTAAGGQAICAPPGEAVDIISDGTNLKYRNLGRVGSYWDFAGTAVPAWVTGCTVPPYLYCNGTTFSSATYPALAAMIGTTLPDARGRIRASFNDGTGRINYSGIVGGTLFSNGGADGISIGSSQLPSTNFTGGTLPLSLSNVPLGTGQQGLGFTPQGLNQGQVAWSSSGNVVITSSAITVASGGAGSQLANMPPAFIGGITLIRAA